MNKPTDSLSDKIGDFIVFVFTMTVLVALITGSI